MQVLALVFVRKLMDFFFTKRELSWLDDLMPESKKKKLEDAEKEVGHGFSSFWCVALYQFLLQTFRENSLNKAYSMQQADLLTVSKL